MKIVNLTGERVYLTRWNGERYIDLDLPPDINENGIMNIARVSYTNPEMYIKESRTVSTLEVAPGFIMDTIKLNGNPHVHNLPEPTTDTWYLVTLEVMNALPERKDLVAADTWASENNGYGRLIVK